MNQEKRTIVNEKKSLKRLDFPRIMQSVFVSTVFLLGSRTHGNIQQFTHFTLNAQIASTSSRETATYRMASPKKVGRFQLFSDALSKFSEDCVNTISEADDLPKTEIQVMWVAPQTGSGCVALRAMVYEDSKSWYADDGQLTKIICESTEKRPTAECCACDEAKYSVRQKPPKNKFKFLCLQNPNSN